MSDTLLARLRATIADTRALSSGSECRVYAFGPRYVIKAYPRAHIRDFALARQRLAYAAGFGPQTFGKFDAPGHFCYVSERVTAYWDAPPAVCALYAAARVKPFRSAHVGVFGEEPQDLAERNIGFRDAQPLLIDFGPLSFSNTGIEWETFDE